jgi:hypothetical protein
LKQKDKKRLLEIGIWVFGLVAGILLTMVFDAYFRPAIMPALAEKPEISINVFQSHAPYQNQSHVEYIVMIQQNMSKAKSTNLENVYLVFDFNNAIVSAKEERVEGTTNPTVRVGGGFLVVANNTIQTDVRYTELLVDIENLKPSGLISLAVVVDPTYQGNLARFHIVQNPTSRFFGSFEYNALGVTVKKDVSGDIPAPRS